MNKFALCFAISAMIPLGAFAQQPKQPGESDLLKKLDSINSLGDADNTHAPAARTSAAAGKTSDSKKSGAGKDDADQQKGPTEITATKEANYDEKTHKAVFVGNVVVKDPQFTITCEKLTAFLKQQAATTGTNSAPTAKPSAKPAAKGSPASDADKGSTGGGGGLDHAIAEGSHENPVIIVQDKPAENGGQPQHNVGRAERAEYNATTGDVTLIGWPEISQGINLQQATSKDTIMHMNRNAKSMHAEGPTRTVISEQSSQSSPSASGNSSSSRQ